MDNTYKPCSHYTQFCFVLPKQFVFVNRKPFKWKRFFHLPKFSQMSLNLKDSVENIWTPTIFYQATKVLCFVTAFLRRVISISRTWPITELEFLTGFYWHFWLYQKFRCMNKVAKTKDWWLKNFVQTPNSNFRRIIANRAWSSLTGLNLVAWCYQLVGCVRPEEILMFCLCLQSRRKTWTTVFIRISAQPRISAHLE